MADFAPMYLDPSVSTPAFFTDVYEYTMLEASRRDGTADRLHFLDLNHDLIDSELKRQQENRRSGPIPENMIRDITSMMTKGGAR